MPDPEKDSEDKDLESGADSQPEESGEQPDNEEAKSPKADDEDEEPPVRKSAKDYIIERKGRQLEKARQKATSDEGEEDEPEEPNDEATVDQRRIGSTIRREISRALFPITKTFKDQADESELQAALARHPEAKSLEKQVRRFMTHTAYKDVSAEFIVLGLMGKRGLLKNPAVKTKADADANADRMGGTTRRPKETGRLPDFSKMSDAEFDEWERTHNR